MLFVRRKEVFLGGGKVYKSQMRGVSELNMMRKPGTHLQPRRVGVLAIKCGMIPDFDEWGVRHALTVLQLQNNQVIQVKTKEHDGVDSIQVGAGLAKATRVNKAARGRFEKAGTMFKRHLAEFRVSSDAVLDVGTPLTVDHFVPGQFVDIQGKTIGKGFQGGMKRHGWSGMPATHGVSRTHRAMGGSGGRQDPGRVFPGKTMAGHMGNVNRTVQNLRVFKLDSKLQLIYVIGAVPGKKGSLVKITDAKKKFVSFDGKVNEAVASKLPEFYGTKITEQIKTVLPWPTAKVNSYSEKKENSEQTSDIKIMAPGEKNPLAGLRAQVHIAETKAKK